MTKSEIVKRIQTIRDIMQKGDLFYADAEVMTAAIEAISTSSGDKLYTAFDVIRLVQEAVSEEICGLDDGGIGMLVAYEVERGIIGKLVKEDANDD